MLAEHIRAELVQTKSIEGGRSVEIWTSPPAKPDNHLWTAWLAVTRWPASRAQRSVNWPVRNARERHRHVHDHDSN